MLQIRPFGGLVVVAIVIVINSVIGEFSWVHLIWLTDVTPDYSQLSDYNPIQWLVNNNVVNAPIKFEEIVRVMIKNVIFFLSRTVELSIKALA